MLCKNRAHRRPKFRVEYPERRVTYPPYPNPFSRRINIQHRLVYQVYAEQRTVKVIRMWTHYE